MNSELFRTEIRQAAYRRALRKALVFSLAAHLLTALSINPELVLRFFLPRVEIGLPGRNQRGDLAPEEERGDSRVALVRVRRFTGSVTLTNLDVTGTKAAGPAPARPVSPNAGTPVPAFEEESATPGRSGGSGAGPVFELGEDWVVLPKAGPPAHTEKFQVLRIVRPEYPYTAVRNGVQGLVKLEVRVDTTGKVVAVQAVENTAADGTLEAAAVRAMFAWSFRPYQIESRAVPFTLFVPFRYRLTD